MRGRKNRKPTKLRGLLLWAVLIMTLLPAMPTAAAGHPTGAEIKIGDFDFSVNPYYKNGAKVGTPAEYNAWYDAATGVLELKGFYETNRPIRNESALPLTVKVTGANALTVTDDAVNFLSVSGIYSFGGELFLVGDGSLRITAIGGNTAYPLYGKHVMIGDRVTLNISAQPNADAYGIYGVEGVEIRDEATVTVSSTINEVAAAGAGISASSGEIRFSSKNPTVINLAGWGECYCAVQNDGNPDDAAKPMAGNGNISFLGKGKVSIINSGKFFAVGIASYSSIDGKPGKILLQGADVEIINCDDDMVNGYGQTSLNEADIIVRDSRLKVVSDREPQNNQTGKVRKGLESGSKGILIENSEVSVATQLKLIEKLAKHLPVKEMKEVLKSLTEDTKAKLAAEMLLEYMDVKTGQWYSGDLAVIMKMGLVKGTAANTVSPLKNVTGREMMAMLIRSMGREVMPIIGGDWYAPYESEAAALKLDEGIRFDLAKDLTRAEVARMMYQYIKLNEKTAVQPDANVLARVKDMAEIPNEYKEAVAYMYQLGILKGYEDGSFAPNKNVSRIEVISLLARLLAL